MRFPMVAVLWAALLVVGFAVVLVLGAPVASTADELEAALHPAPPVSQEAAEASAATIVRLQFPSFRDIAPSTSLAIVVRRRSTASALATGYTA